MTISKEVLDKSFRFAIDMVELHKLIGKKKHDKTLSRKILRTGTQVGSELQNALDAANRNDRVTRLKMAFRNARESKYWIKLLVATDYIDPVTGQRLYNEVVELTSITKNMLEELKLEKKTQLVDED